MTMNHQLIRGKQKWTFFCIRSSASVSSVSSIQCEASVPLSAAESLQVTNIEWDAAVSNAHMQMADESTTTGAAASYEGELIGLYIYILNFFLFAKGFTLSSLSPY